MGAHARILRRNWHTGQSLRAQHKKYRSLLIFVQLVLVLYYFCTSSILSCSRFRIPIVLLSNLN